MTEIELFDYLHQDPQTDVILLYLEELRDGRGLIEAARRVTRGDEPKPILAIKSGRTPQGADAAASHTGSLAGEDAICDAVFREAGIVRVASIEELFNAAILYAYQPLPAGNRLAIVTNAGGPGVMATDAAVRAGLRGAAAGRRPPWRSCAASLPATANMKNPVDVIGDARADRYTAAMEAVLDDPNVDQLLVILTPQSMTDIEAIAHGICRIHEQAGKPIACSFMGAADVGCGHPPACRRPTFPTTSCPSGPARPWPACRRSASGAGSRWASRAAFRWTRRPCGRSSTRAPAGYLDEDQALAVLAAYGLPVPAAPALHHGRRGGRLRRAPRLSR